MKISAICLAASAILWVGCGNKAPTVTVGDLGSMSGCEGVPLTANVNDPEDGAALAVTWSSDLEGELTLTDGKANLRPGTHALTASVTDAEGLIASATGTVNVTGEALVVGRMRKLLLFCASPTELVQKASAELPGIFKAPANDMIFNVVQHPTKKQLLYTTMLKNYDWGNGRIDRWRLGTWTLAHDGFTFTQLNVASMPCSTDSNLTDDEDGRCAPVGLAFSLDGTKLWLQDDRNDVFQLYTVADNGNLTFVHETGNTELHGIAVHPTDSNVIYNGNKVFTVAGNNTVSSTGGTGGNSTKVVTLPNGQLGLLTGVSESDNNQFGIYNIHGDTNKLSPVQIDLVTVAGYAVIAMDATSNLSRIITVGQNVAHTWTFNGALVTANSLTLTESPTHNHRDVVLSADGTRAYVAWFGGGGGTFTGGGLKVFAIDGAGMLTPSAASISFGELSRVVRKVTW